MTDCEALVRAHGGDVLAYLVRRVPDREDAADVYAATLESAWKSARRLPTGEDEGRLWLFGIARNALRHHRRGGVRRERLADALRARLAVTHAPTAAPSDDVIILRQALERLDPLDRELVTLHGWEGFSHEEIAVIVGLRPAAVRQRYSRARAALRAFVADQAAHAHR